VTEFFDIMAAPFIACLILTGIHSYLGMHVLDRGVIFVDLALAQIAALGSTVGFLFGFGLHSRPGYFISLAFTLLGAAIFAATKPKKAIVPHEAIIGITYAVAAAACIIILSWAPDGGEELKSLLVGHLLFVEWPEVYKVALLYSVIGYLHYKFRKEFCLVTSKSKNTEARFLNVRFWDFLFYASLGFVVTSSVEIVGVLLVFSFLIVPAVCTAYLSRNFVTKLLLGWAIGFLVSLAGVVFSYCLDLPTGATIVCTFGLAVPLCVGYSSKVVS